MRLFATIILAALFCATATAQTLKSLMYNTTNGQVVANTGTNVLTFTNAVNLNAGISENGILIWDSQNNEFYAGATFHGEVAFGGSNAAIHAATTRTNLGLGATNNVTFAQITATDEIRVYVAGTNYYTLAVDEFSIFAPINSTHPSGYGFAGTNAATAAATTRTNLSLGLPALTNTSNVTMMRALSGSTNTNEPYSGSISVVGTNNTNTLVFSNGILQSVQ